MERFNHGWVAGLPQKAGKCVTLEIGAGLGEHALWEVREPDYWVMDIRQDFCHELERKFPSRVICADIQGPTPFPRECLDRVIAIHVLEHLPKLSDALLEIWTILKYGGIFDVVIPCEGGLAHRVARNLSAKRLFENTYHMDFEPIRKAEHCNDFPKILKWLKRTFTIEESRYFPCRIPWHHANLAVGFRLRKKIPNRRPLYTTHKTTGDLL
jgi:SAM-dependent methyltransferase